MISDFAKIDGRQFVANERIDQCGYRGTYEDWVQMLRDPNGPGPNWYQEYLQEYDTQQHESGEVAYSFSAWIAHTLNECLCEAGESDSGLPPLRADSHKGAYLEDGSTCPYCGGSDLEGGSFDVSGPVVSQEMYCLACKEEWTAFYRLEGIAKE